MKKDKLDFIVNQLRKGSYYWPERAKAKSAARVRRGVYICAICQQETAAKDINMDHVVPVKDVRGTNNNIHEIADRIMAEEGGWQVLCIPCHKIKTKIENVCRDEIEASIAKMNKELDKLYKKC